MVIVYNIMIAFNAVTVKTTDLVYPIRRVGFFSFMPLLQSLLDHDYSF